MSSVTMDRPRYVAFVVESPRAVPRGELGRWLQGEARRNGLEGVQLTRYEWPHGIARCPHEALPGLRELLLRPGPSWRLNTVSTSGTLRALTARTGELRSRGPRPGADSAGKGD